jgi:hypothetical protein
MGPNVMFFVLDVLPFFGGVACFITNNIVKPLPLLPFLWLGLGF